MGLLCLVATTILCGIEVGKVARDANVFALFCTVILWPTRIFASKTTGKAFDNINIALIAIRHGIAKRARIPRYTKNLTQGEFSSNPSPRCCGTSFIVVTCIVFGATSQSTIGTHTRKSPDSIATRTVQTIRIIADNGVIKDEGIS